MILQKINHFEIEKRKKRLILYNLSIFNYKFRLVWLFTVHIEYGIIYEITFIHICICASGVTGGRRFINIS